MSTSTATVRELRWGELQALSNQAANVLAGGGVERGRPRGGRPAAHPGDGRDLLRHLEARRGPALDVGALRRRGDPAPALGLRAEGPRHRRRQRRALRGVGRRAADPRRLLARRRARPNSRPPTRPPTTPRSSTTRRARPAWPRGSCTPIATCWPTRSSSTATKWRTASASTAWGSGRGPLASPHCSAPGGSARSSASTSARAVSTRSKQLDFLSRREVTNVFTTPTAMRAMMAVEDAGERYPQRFRRVCSAGEPLNPEAIRWFREQYGITVLDYYGLTESYPLCANFPFMEVREGSMGKPMPGWDVAILDEDERPVERASAARSACAPGRTRITRSATGATTRPRAKPSAASGSTRRTLRGRTRTATTGTRGAPTT